MTASHDKTGWTIPQLILVALLFLPLYLLFPSIDYDANGVIEATWVESGVRFSPNHILYTFIGRGLYAVAKTFDSSVRAITVLQLFNAFCGAIAVALACGALGKRHGLFEALPFAEFLRCVEFVEHLRC